MDNSESTPIFVSNKKDPIFPIIGIILVALLLFIFILVIIWLLVSDNETSSTESVSNIKLDTTNNLYSDILEKQVWSTELLQCSVIGFSDEQCVPKGSIGEQIRKETCISSDNGCYKIVNGSKKYYELGDVIETKVSCTNYKNNICDPWIGLNSNINPSFILSSSCIVDEPGPFNLLREGYTTTDLVCDGDECVDLNITGECNKIPILASQIRNGTLPNNINPILCNSNQSNKSELPGILQPCRLFPGVNSNLGPFSILINTLNIFIIPNIGFVAPTQVPSTDNLIVPLRSSKSKPIDLLRDVPLMIIPFDYLTSTSECPLELNVFNSSLMMSLGIRSFDNVSMTAQILSGIQNIYTGWLIVPPKQPYNIVWKQGLNSYQGYGISSYDASTFKFHQLEKYNPEPKIGYPGGNIGSMKVSMKFAGDTIFLPILGGGSSNLNNVEMLIFSLDTDLRQRIKSKCNLFT